VSISHTVTGRFSRLSEKMTDADEVMQLQHSGSDLADVWSESRLIQK